MTEEFLHFIYKYRLWKEDCLFLTTGEKFEIIDTGIHNQNSGPDFFNAKIKISGKVWAGNVELHINSSDWNKHKHDKNLAYNNVILHIVFCEDKEIAYCNGENIPTWKIRFDHILYNKYAELKTNEKQIPCGDYITFVNEFKINMFIEKMGVERLMRKTEYIQLLLDRCNSDLEQAFYVSLARSFGFGKNALPFEQLALATPINIVRKYSNNLTIIEALLFGQSGLLPENNDDEYIKKLNIEYEYLKHKHKLEPILAELWKKSKLRPANFPHVRIAQLSALLQRFQGLFAKVTQQSKVKEIKVYFDIETSEYWNSHYNFDGISEKANTHFGNLAFHNLVINTIAPFKYYYSKNFKTDNSESIAIDWLNELKPEKNAEVKAWESVSIFPENAFESQALINLKTNYCDVKKCLNCPIGYEIMKEISKL